MEAKIVGFDLGKTLCSLAVRDEKVRVHERRRVRWDNRKRRLSAVLVS